MLCMHSESEQKTLFLHQMTHHTPRISLVMQFLVHAFQKCNFRASGLQIRQVKLIAPQEIYEALSVYNTRLCLNINKLCVYAVH